MEINFSLLNQVGLITLQRPKALNSLNLEMVSVLADTLRDWQRNDNIKVIFVNTKEDHFCAGGDVKQVRESILQAHRIKVEDFFCNEYLSDFLLYNMEKPVIAFSKGFTMGAGLGLFRSANYRIASEKSVYAMPEIAIGFFCDVGASWFLNQVMEPFGHFLGLTGARFNSADALDMGIANYFMSESLQHTLIEELADITWEKDAPENHEIVANLLKSYHQSGRLESQLLKHGREIENVMQAPSVIEFFEKLRSSKLNEIYEQVRYGSPLSVSVIFELLNRARKWSLGDAFIQEWLLALKFSSEKDFPEGVRALLVEKDKKPTWQYESFSGISTDLVNSYFDFKVENNKMKKAISGANLG